MNLPAVSDTQETSAASYIAVMRALTPKQRVLLKRAAIHPEKTLHAISQILGYSAATVFRWMRQPHFVRAYRMLEAQQLESISITKGYVLSRTREVVERSMQSAPVVDHEGNPVMTGTPDGNLALAYQFDGRTALKGLELLGKAGRVWGEDKPPPAAPVGPGLTVIVQTGHGIKAGEGPTLTRVEVRLPEPEPAP